jgi:pimeloyl-ACP methyl ester carboxylesterase
MKIHVCRIAAMFAFLLVVASIACTLIPIRTSGTAEAADLADPDSRFIRVEGVELHYKLFPFSGSDASVNEGAPRPAFLLLHGFGASVYSWREVALALSVWGDVIAYDRPAFGLSERPLRWKGRSPYSPESQVSLAFGLLDALGYERAIFVGNSAGGTVAMNAALARPERVAALVLVSPAVYAGGGAPALVRPLLYFPPINHLGPLLARRIADGGDDFIRSAWHDPSRVSQELLAGYRRPLMVRDWERALWELTKASRASGLAKRLAEFNLPVLVVTGDDDRIVPTEQSIRLASELPNAELVLIPGSGHLAHEESPQEFLAAIDKFILKRFK